MSVKKTRATGEDDVTDMLWRIHDEANDLRRRAILREAISRLTAEARTEQPYGNKE